MKTITFYSYKGGVGRTLALANLAKRLAEFDKRVCILDFDLEAPGMPFKFTNELRNVPIESGIVDYIHQFQTTFSFPESVKSIVTPIKFHSQHRLDIDFIAAGNVENAQYWKKLSAIDWHEIFYKKHSQGVTFFLDFKTKVEKELKPDYLLIDSRTGITEITGITINLLADDVVVVSANNEENLIGSRQIIKNILSQENNLLGKTPKIHFVLSRIPYPDSEANKIREKGIVRNAASKTEIPADLINLIHTDRELEVKESLKIGVRGDENILPVAEDYLNLFEKLFIKDFSEEQLTKFDNLKRAERFFEKSKIEEDYEKKIALLDEAILLDNETWEYYFERAYQYNYFLSDYQSALRDFNIVLNIDKDNYKALSNKSVSLYRLQKFYEALATIDNAILINDTLGFNFDMRANIKELLKLDRQSILDDRNRAIELEPNKVKFYNNRADFYRMWKKYDLALADIYKGLSIDSENIYCLITMSEIKFEQNLIDEFFFYFESTLKKVKHWEIHEVKSFIKNDQIYQQFYQESRFINLLKKYNFDLEEILNSTL